MKLLSKFVLDCFFFTDVVGDGQTRVGAGPAFVSGRDRGHAKALQMPRDGWPARVATPQPGTKKLPLSYLNLPTIDFCSDRSGNLQHGSGHLLGCPGDGEGRPCDHGAVHEAVRRQVGLAHGQKSV